MGKSTIVSGTNLREERSHTTRPIRDGETNGVEYNFVTKEEFLKMKSDGLLAEEATVYGNYYGTTWEELAMSDICIIDPQGVAELKRLKVSIYTILLVGPARTVNRTGHVEPELDPSNFNLTINTTGMTVQQEVDLVEAIHKCISVPLD